jgi:hypothetical protein
LINRILKSNPHFSLKLLLLSVLLSGGALFSQTHPFLSKFTATAIGESIFLAWTIKAGSTCDGIQIFRSADSLNFDKISEIPGVCGDVFESRSYSFTDNTPEKNRVNFYKIGLNENGFSQIVSVDLIVFSNNGYQVRPNPIVNESIIKFENSNHQMHELCVYSLNGSKILQIKTSNDYFSVNRANLSPGIYAFTISSTEQIQQITGKFSVY